MASYLIALSSQALPLLQDAWPQCHSHQFRQSVKRHQCRQKMPALLPFFQYMRQLASSGICASRLSFNLVLFTRPGTCPPSCSSEYEYIFAKSDNWKTIGLGASSIYITSSVKAIASKELAKIHYLLALSRVWCFWVDYKESWSRMGGNMHRGYAYHQLPILTTAYDLEALWQLLLRCYQQQMLLLYEDLYLLWHKNCEIAKLQLFA